MFNLLKRSIFSLLSINLIAGCHPDNQEHTPPRPVWVMEIGASPSTTPHYYTGEIKSRYESNIGFRIRGKIISRAVSVGDTVKPGQLIARLDAKDTQLNTQAANADVQTAQANLALAKAELDRRQQLFQQKFISQSALDTYATQWRTAQARLQQAESQAAVSRHQTAYTTLVADRAGVIGMIDAEPGQVVSEGQTIAKIYDLNTLEVAISVPESTIDSLHAGDSATIMLEENGQTYHGVIREIAPAANTQTHAFDLRIRFSDADHSVKLGMTARIAFAEKASLEQIWLPVTAVTRDSDSPAVWVIDAHNHAHLRKIRTGALSEQGVPVLSGLSPQEKIATIGVHTLTENMLVQPVYPSPEVLR